MTPVAIAVVAVALVAGALAGAALARRGRRCLPEADWERAQRDLADAHRRIAELQRAVELADAMREQGRAETRHLRAGLERARDERAVLAARDERGRGEIADLTRQRDLLLREVVVLQRRVAELRVARDRGVDVVEDVPADGPAVGDGPAAEHADPSAPEVVIDLRDGVDLHEGAGDGPAGGIDLRDGDGRRHEAVPPERGSEPAPLLAAD